MIWRLNLRERLPEISLEADSEAHLPNTLLGVAEEVLVAVEQLEDSGALKSVAGKREAFSIQEISYGYFISCVYLSPTF